SAAAGTFAASEPLDLWYNLPDGSAAPFVTGATGMVTASADGSLSATIASDDWSAIPANATSIVAHGANSGVNVAYVFNRTTPSQPAAQGPATLTVDTTAHTITAAAGVFTPGEPLDLWYNVPDGSAAPFVTSATGNVVAG